MLCDLHLSYGNYVEAALTTLLHADEYSWSAEVQKEPPSKISSNSKELQLVIEPGRVTKERLYHKAIKYFGDGKYWELGIAILQEIRVEGANQLRTQMENLVFSYNY